MNIPKLDLGGLAEIQPMRFPRIGKSMNIQVEKCKLLETLRKNKDQHTKDYIEAMIEYRSEVVKALTENLKEAKECGEIRTSIRLVCPVNYVKEYEKAITIFEWELQELVDLTEEQFTMYVLDQWHWSRDFAQNTMCYSARTA